jgi:hypothetical protein
LTQAPISCGGVTASPFATRDKVDVENVMCGSDFPHHDSTIPRSKQVLDDIFEDIPGEERYLITAGNVRNIYHLPVE